MGQDIESITYTREQRQRFRQKVQLCLDVFERMLAYSHFDFERPMTGMEIELNLAGSDFRPKMDNALVLERIADHPINRIEELLPWQISLTATDSSVQTEALAA